MGQPQQLLPGIEDLGDDASYASYEALSGALQKHVAEFADKHEVPFGMMALLLIDLGVGSRMIEYLVTTAKPSGSGLKLDLDRFRREFDDYIRDCKRDADDFVCRSKDALAEGLAELAVSDGREGG